jgi:tetratricopeptide (TPR) repeat protein
VPVVQEVDSVGLSNQLYTAIQTTCYQHLAYKVGSEDDKTIHEIVEDFVDGLEADLKRDLDQFAKQIVNIVELFGFQLAQTKIQAIVSDVTDSNFAGVRLAIRDLERVTREVLQTDFPKETNALKAFFTGAAQEFTANLSGKTLMSQEAVIGTVIGSFVAPGVGSVIGGAIGGWLGGNKQQKALEQLIDKYQKARGKVFQEWESLMQVVYGKLSDLLYGIGSIRLLTYQSLNQAIEFYNQGNEYLETDCQKAIEFYDQAIQANPGLVLAWNNKGYALNQLEKFEEAIPVLVQSIQLDRTLVIALNNLGDSLQGLGKNEEAIAAYEESIKLEPENYAAWWGIGVCLYNLQEFEKVIEIAGKLIDLDSENFLGWYAKASCQSRLDYTQPALENLKEAVRLNPEASQELAKTNSDFDQLRKDERFQALMESSVGVDYATLKRYLKGKQWREADQETARLMKEVIQKVTNSTEINQNAINVFPCVDLSTIDSLWGKNSDGQFSFSVQKEIYQQSSQNRDEFGNKTGWRIKDADGNYSWRSNSNFDYNSATKPRGHLPSSLWAGEDVIWVENRRDRLIALFARMDGCSIGKA